MAEVERFWCSRDGQFDLDSDGFLADPADLILGRINRNPQVISTSDLQNTRAVVMLGETGAGKSKLLERPDRLIPPGPNRLAINLTPFGS